MKENCDIDNLASTPVDVRRSVSTSSDGDHNPDMRDPNTARLSQAQAEKLRILFPHLNDAARNEVAEVLHGYCAIAWRINERLAREHPDVIDELMQNRRMKVKVDSSN